MAVSSLAEHGPAVEGDVAAVADATSVPTVEGKVVVEDSLLHELKRQARSENMSRERRGRRKDKGGRGRMREGKRRIIIRAQRLRKEDQCDPMTSELKLEN